MLKAAPKPAFTDPSNVNITGGSINNTPIGGTTRAAGNFTTLDANGNVVLGDANTDTITATARFASDLVPSTDNARDLGTSALKWKDVYAMAFTENGFPVVSQTDIGTAANEIPLNQYLGSMAYQDVESVAADNVSITEILRVGSYTAATIPTAGTVGRVAYITDADDDLDWGDVLDATGSNDTTYLFWDNGTDWTVIGK